MNKIKKLIKELCPNGVEWKKLGEVAQISKGEKPSKIQDVGLYKYINAGTTESGFCDIFNSKGNAVTTPSHGQGGIGFIGYQERSFWCGALCYRIYDIEGVSNIRYIYHFLSQNNYLIKKFINEGGVPYYNQIKLEQLSIPLPPLPIQTEIVRILDKFVEQQEQLERLIELRKKQYEYYREEMLKPKEGEKWERKTLGEIGKNLDSKRKPITSSKRMKGPYPYYGASGIVDYVEGYIFDGTYLLISEDGANLIARSTPIAFTIEGKNWVNNHAHVIEINDYNIRRLVEIYLNSISLEEFISGGAQPKLNQENLNKITIPLPTTERLSFIIKSLDSFESSISDLTSALESSKRRYEYYRDEMMRF